MIIQRGPEIRDWHHCHHNISWCYHILRRKQFLFKHINPMTIVLFLASMKWSFRNCPIDLSFSTFLLLFLLLSSVVSWSLQTTHSGLLVLLRALIYLSAPFSNRSITSDRLIAWEIKSLKLCCNSWKAKSNSSSKQVPPFNGLISGSTYCTEIFWFLLTTHITPLHHSTEMYYVNNVFHLDLADGSFISTLSSEQTISSSTVGVILTLLSVSLRFRRFLNLCL